MRYFWAKTTQDAQPGISVFEHMMNVGHVARLMAETSIELLSLSNLDPSLAGALAALHDLGKISPGFQRKCEQWLKDRGLSDIARNGRWDTEMESDHGKITHTTLQKYFVENKVDERTATFLSAVLGGHHGRLSRPNDRGFKPQKSIVEHQSDIDWEQERKLAADAVMTQFGIKLSELFINDSSPALWWLGGLTSVADWIGSDERHFPVQGGMDASKVAGVAGKCLQEIGFGRPRIVRGLSFHDLFHDTQKPNVRFVPNKMQSSALSTIKDQGVYVIEAPMGMGKTEAALGSAYQLLVSGKANGIYFALPTQATSNRIYLRMAEFVKRIAPTAVGSKIIHGNSWLLDKQAPISPVGTANGIEESATIGRDWFSSAKRALLAPFGVGTVDQALLGIVAAKHFFVRHYALAGKVVILDEIHSYDLYTGTLIDCLIETLERLGCTIIVLSATLSRARRNVIVPAKLNRAVSAFKEPYPLITGRQHGAVLKPLAVRPPAPRKVDIIFKSEKDAISLAVEDATKGACVLCVCNTVDAAQRIYLRVRSQSDGRFPIGLLHARFPFWRREELENKWMNRLGKDASTRCASILVSTQIVEQSVDLDADLLITELAPTDMLLQRLGRLWRHERGKRPLSKTQMCIIEERTSLQEFRKMEKRDIAKALGEKSRFYDPYVLLRSLEQWKKLKKVGVPVDIRKLIEATYRQRKREPSGWKQLLIDAEGKKLAFKGKALMSSNLWQVALEDEEGVQTRLNELPTLSLVLCRSISESSAEFIDGTSRTIASEEFQLTTAQAIHRNLVKVPQYLFEKTEVNLLIARYLRGRQCVGLVQSDGVVSVRGLKNGVALRWDIELALGLVIEKRKGQEDQ